MGPPLVLRVRRVGGDGTLPPCGALITDQFADRHLEWLRGVLDGDLIAVGLGVVVPQREGDPPFEATRAYSPSCSSRMRAISRSVPLLFPRMVTTSPGPSHKVSACWPPERS
jgi:hypothetical protein